MKNQKMKARLRRVPLVDSTDGQKRPPQPHCQPQGILWGLLTCFSLPSQDSIWKKPVEVVPHAPMGQRTPVIQTPSLLAYLARLANQVQNLWSPVPAVRVLGDEMGFKWDEGSES